MIGIDDGCFMGPIPEEEEIKRFHMKSIPSDGSRLFQSEFRWRPLLFLSSFLLVKETHKKDTDCRDPK